MKRNIFYAIIALLFIVGCNGESVNSHSTIGNDNAPMSGVEVVAPSDSSEVISDETTAADYSERLNDNDSGGSFL